MDRIALFLKPVEDPARRGTLTPDTKNSDNRTISQAFSPNHHDLGVTLKGLGKEWNMIGLTIDGKQVSSQPEETILQVALRNHIRIPTLCYHGKMSPIGSCRLCLVEVEGTEKPMAACTTPVLEGMAVNTESKKLFELRRMAIRMMLINHPLDCHVCEASGACALQDMAYEYGVAEHGFGEVPVQRNVGPYATPLITYHPDKCVLCLRCVHACTEIKQIEALSITLRGSLAHVKGDPDRCISCGECWHVCPVGALTQNLTKPPMRLHQMEKVRTTCSYCGVGCQMELRVLDNKVWGVTTDDGMGVNRGSLCVKGRFGFDFIHHPDRLTKPLIKEKDRFREVSWNEAIAFAAERLKQIRTDHGPDAIMGFSSARCTNEENYLFQKFMRAGVGTNNVDHCARL
jgi:predicted molibdopterin-dependent oxidoreductase YjgC